MEGAGVPKRPRTSRNGLLRAKKPRIRPDWDRIGLQIRYRRCYDESARAEPPPIHRENALGS